MAIRAWMRRTTSHLAVLWAVLALAAAVVVHHGGPAALEMGGMHGAMGGTHGASANAMGGTPGGAAHDAGTAHRDDDRNAGETPGDHGMSLAAMCLGTVAAAAAVVGLVGAVLRRRRLPRSSRARHAVLLRLVPTAPLPRARSSPLFLRLAVIRR